jgi:NAD(P)-dependent dehydrogenase (short-subunit alcohol dehydrogenase family)
VVIVSRNAEKCKATAAWVRRNTGNTWVDFLVADLSDQVQIRDAAAEFRRRYDRLDVLVNNAGARFMRYLESGQGLEMTLALNHLAPFLLTHLLLDVLRASAPARVINVTSGSQTAAIDFESLAKWRSYDGRKAYAQSKLAGMLFTLELSRRLEGSGVTANAVNPGGAATSFNRNNGWLYWLRHVLAHVKAGNLIGPATAAETSIYLAASPDVAGVSGCYFHEKKAIPASEAAMNRGAAQRLWQVSAELTGLSP